jgi:hypothetical protein
MFRTRHRLWGGLVPVLALTLVACGSDATEAPRVASDTPLEPAEYAEHVSAICDEAVQGADDAIDSIEEVYDIDTASSVLLDGAKELAALTPPEDRSEMAQALVESLTEYSDLVRSAENDPEEYSQNQNALELTISVRVAGLDTECDAVPYVLEPPAAPEDGLDEYFEVAFGDDPDADGLAQRCFEGELAACDEVASVDAYGAYGATCGERVYIEEANGWPDCVELFVGDEPARGQILTEPRETVWCTGNLEDCG